MLSSMPFEKLNLKEMNVTKTLHIAVCDDDEDTCELIKLIAEKKGHRVTACLHPNDLENLQQKENPDVIFIDINWGNVNGINFVKNLRNSNEMQIYALSGDANIREITARQNLDGYIEKPFSLNDIRSLMDDLAENK